MRAFVVTAPRESAVIEVDPPIAGAGQVVVDVHRVGVCGTDVEFFTGEMAYLHQGHASFPMRLGHEWWAWSAPSATASTARGSAAASPATPCSAAAAADAARPAGSTCATTASRSASAATGRARSPSSCSCPPPRCTRCPTPSTTRPVLWSSPAATRCAPSRRRASAAADASSSTGRARSGCSPRCSRSRTASRCTSPDAAARRSTSPRSIGLHSTWTLDEHPRRSRTTRSSTARSAPRSLHGRSNQVEPGGRVVLIGLSGAPSLVDTRDLVLSDVTAVGILSASPGLADTIEHYADGARRPASARGRHRRASPRSARHSPAIRPAGIGAGPKIHVDPRL